MDFCHSAMRLFSLFYTIATLHIQYCTSNNNNNNNNVSILKQFSNLDNNNLCDDTI